jgi:GDSL-like lipase/acylhydrolase family protein
VSACRLGVLAFGDSITNGGGELQWGVALQSWALWVARGLALPYTGLAVDGARVGDVLAEQVPSVPPDARYDLGCLYVGVNDVRGLDWDRELFERGHRAALDTLRVHCDRILTMTVPLDLGRPPAGGKVHEVNAAIAERALEVLAADGLTVHVRPSALIRYETTRWRRLRGDATYAYRHAKVSARSGLIRARVAWDRRRAARSGTARSGT